MYYRRRTTYRRAGYRKRSYRRSYPKRTYRRAYRRPAKVYRKRYVGGRRTRHKVAVLKPPVGPPSKWTIDHLPKDVLDYTKHVIDVAQGTAAAARADAADATGVKTEPGLKRSRAE